MPGWIYGLEPVTRWLERETAICKRVLRLRAYLYLKIPWIETSDLINAMLGSRSVCEVPSNRKWLTLCEHLSSSGQFLDDHKEEFEKREKIYNQWVSVSKNLGMYAETLVRKAFLDSGYSVSKTTFQYSSGLPEVYQSVEIDADCIKPGWHLGVQVKNVVSDVIIDPNKIQHKSNLYKRLAKQFEFCSKNGITPILVAPFIDGSFYCFDDSHKGLHCQTLVQFFSPENEELCNDVKKVLKFGNVRVVEEVPITVKSWIARVPDMWTRRHRI